MIDTFVPSVAKAPGRATWIRSSDGEGAKPLLVFLDGELYRDRVDAVQVLDALETQDLIPPVISVFVSHVNAAARHDDYVCDAAYARFLADELVPEVADRHTVDASRIALIGLSLSGLAAAYTALTARCFRAAICQSPSFWWQREHFAASLSPAVAKSPVLWVSVGDAETSFGVEHPPTGLFQGTSQIDSCHRGVDALRSAGYTTEYHVFSGGHDPACWREDLRRALPWAMSRLGYPTATSQMRLRL